MKKNQQKQKIKLIPFSKITERWMKDPEFKRGYDDLELEFKLICAIIESRMKKGMTQKQLAKKIGTKQSAIARFESGKSNPTLSTLKKMARGLDLVLTAREF